MVRWLAKGQGYNAARFDGSGGMDEVLAYLEAGRERFLAELCDLLRIPSISSAEAHRADVHACADALANHLRRIGMTRAEVLPTPGHPVVYAEWLEAPGAPTALVYGHYDVQPVDPLALWHTPPFEPTVRDDLLFARGAVDDKGQVYMHLAAAEAFLAVRGRLPLNLKVLLE